MSKAGWVYIVIYQWILNQSIYLYAHHFESHFLFSKQRLVWYSMCDGNLPTPVVWWLYFMTVDIFSVDNYFILQWKSTQELSNRGPKICPVYTVHNMHWIIKYICHQIVWHRHIQVPPPLWRIWISYIFLICAHLNQIFNVLYLCCCASLCLFVINQTNPCYINLRNKYWLLKANWEELISLSPFLVDLDPILTS